MTALGIKMALRQYLQGVIDGWELLEIVRAYGYTGFTITPDSDIELY